MGYVRREPGRGTGFLQAKHQFRIGGTGAAKAEFT